MDTLEPEKRLAGPAIVQAALSPREGVPPSNGEDALLCAATVLEFHNAGHLSDPRFNVLAPMAFENALVAQLNALDSGTTMKKEKSSEEGSDKASEEEKTSTVLGVAWDKAAAAASSSGADDDVVITGSSYYGPHSTILRSTVSTRLGSFIDPVASFKKTTAVAESGEQKRLRLRVWSSLSRILALHPTVIRSVTPGDVAALLGKLEVLCQGQPNVTALTAVCSMVALAPHLLPPKTSVPPSPAAIIASAQVIDRTFSSISDPSLSLGAALLPEFMLTALGQHPSLAVQVSLLRQLHGEKVTVRRITDDITAALAVSSDPLSLTGKVASAPPVSATSHRASDVTTDRRSQQPCFNWRDKGSCSRPNCPFMHVGPAAATPVTGKCAKCGSPSHGCDKCPLTTQHKLEAKLALQKTELASLTSVQAELATLKASLKLAAAEPALTGKNAALQSPYAAWSELGVGVRAPDLEVASALSSAPAGRGAGEG
jgi:hypothetical protein